MIRKMILPTWLIAAVTLSPGAFAADQGTPGGADTDRAAICVKPNFCHGPKHPISESQGKALSGLLSKFELDTAQPVAELHVLQRRMHDLLGESEVDAGSANALQEKINSLHSSIANSTLQLALASGKILTAAQRAEMKSMMPPPPPPFMHGFMPPGGPMPPRPPMARGFCEFGGCRAMPPPPMPPFGPGLGMDMPVDF